MPLVFNTDDVKDSLTLNEYIQVSSSSELNFEDEGTLEVAARNLKRLANNRHFLMERLLGELEHLQEFQSDNYYGPQVFVIHRAPTYFLRANVWRPLSAVERRIDGYVYDVCHDHNFDLLTVGYAGPGYQARTYSYDFGAVAGFLGEKVDLIDEGIFSLSEGTVAFYRSKKDVHIQIPPGDLFVTLNMIPKRVGPGAPQFQFDEGSRTICRYLQSSSAELLVRLAGILGDDTASPLLERIAGGDSGSHVRALAALSRSLLSPAEDGHTFDVQDGLSAVATDILRRESAEYGACLRIVRP